MRQWLEATHHPYVLAVSSSHPVWQDGVQGTIRSLTAALPETAWAPVSAGSGSQGERLADWAWVQRASSPTAETSHWLLMRRARHDPTDLAYFCAWGPAATTSTELIRVAGRRWAIEVGFEDAKGVLGLDQYEVRNWTPWHRHITLSLLAHAVLAVTRHAAVNAADEKGGPAT